MKITITFVATNIIIGMAEEKKKPGRPAGVNTVDIHYKMSKELFDALPKTIKRNTYINDAVRKMMINDGYLPPKD